MGGSQVMKQQIIEGTQSRTIPNGPVRPTKKQTEKLTELEKASMQDRQQKLFAEKEITL